MTDPEIEHQERVAAGELARRIGPYLVAGADAADIAARYIADLRTHGWRPPLQPAPDAKAGRRNPGAYERGGALARRLLTGRSDPP